MTASDDEPVTVADLLATANRILDQHWRAPHEPWQRRCVQCADDHCPQLESARRHVAEVYAMVRAASAGRSGTANRSVAFGDA